MPLPKTIPELNQLIADAEKLKAELQAAGRAELISKFEREAAELGYDDLASLIDHRRRSKRGRGNGAAHKAE